MSTPPLHLVMPMAGRGSRFERDGFALPKPLIELHGAPFYAWAVDSLAARLPLGERVFVVLREHVERHAIDRDIRGRYPGARVVVIDDVTSGAAETAAIGLAALASDDGPVAVNDCDHAFDASGLATVVQALGDGAAQGALLGFAADSPAFSYVRLDAQRRVTGTVEKQAVSPYAIAGCYLLSSPAVFREHYDAYRASCPYDELFLSGVYNHLIAAGGRVLLHELTCHVPFGTPAELARVDARQLQAATGKGRPA